MIEQHRRLQVERISNLSLASDLAAIHPHGIFVACAPRNDDKRDFAPSPRAAPEL
jgi:hypothetical protein